jgi:hypothetical protein
MSDEWLRRQYGGIEGPGRHTTAAICLKGHVATADIERFGAQVTKFCSKCGATVVTKCNECQALIHFRRHRARQVGRNAQAKAERLGIVYAPDRKAAETAAVKEFGLNNEQRKRLVVQEQP